MIEFRNHAKRRVMMIGLRKTTGFTADDNFVIAGSRSWL
jgi:hypothetical protein